MLEGNAMLLLLPKKEKKEGLNFSVWLFCFFIFAAGCCSEDSLGKGKSQLYCSGTHYIRWYIQKLRFCCSAFVFVNCNIMHGWSYVCILVRLGKVNVQLVIVVTASIAAYFITADKTILECARRNSHLQETLRRQSS